MSGNRGTVLLNDAAFLLSYSLCKTGFIRYVQIYGKYNANSHEILEFELLYISNMSILTDLELTFALFFVLFNSELLLV